MQSFDRFDAGDSISPSFVSMQTYKQLFDALASNNIDLARAFARRMGGRPEVEEEYDRAFEIAMGYALKAIVAGDDATALARLNDLEQACVHKDYVNFAPYVPVLRAIVEQDSAGAEAAFPALLSGHRRESKGRGLFSDMEDKFLCVWGVGLLNLARSRVMNVKVDDPLIPARLVN
jgi:SMC proteins Flexible Hinge Domain